MTQEIYITEPDDNDGSVIFFDDDLYYFRGQNRTIHLEQSANNNGREYSTSKEKNKKE